MLYVYPFIVYSNLAFFFCPQGVQYPGILHRELSESIWLKDVVESMCAYYSDDPAELLEILSSDKIDDARFTQCALFATCRAISMFLLEVFGFNNYI